MTEHYVELYEKNGSKLDSALLVEAKTIKKAAVKAVEELKKVEFIVGYKEVWDAKIKNPEGPKSEDYEILRKGELVVDSETGEKLSDLEKRV